MSMYQYGSTIIALHGAVKIKLLECCVYKCTKVQIQINKNQTLSAACYVAFANATCSTDAGFDQCCHSAIQAQSLFCINSDLGSHLENPGDVNAISHNHNHALTMVNRRFVTWHLSSTMIKFMVNHGYKPQSTIGLWNGTTVEHSHALVPSHLLCVHAYTPCGMRFQIFSQYSLMQSSMGILNSPSSRVIKDLEVCKFWDWWILT